VRQTKQRQLEATLQRILNEYPTDALQRILSWAVQGKLTHDWGACLNAAAVGHGIDGPGAVQREIGVPAVFADVIAMLWDRLGDRDACQRRTQELVSEILASRARSATRAYSGMGPTAPLPARTPSLSRV